MSELISGRDALIALANGEELIWKKPKWDISESEYVDKDIWSVNEILNCKADGDGKVQFYLKPKTITINEIDVTAPFEPKQGDKYYFIYSDNENGFGWNEFICKDNDADFIQFGAWRTEEEIKQVVNALRSIFKGE